MDVHLERAIDDGATLEFGRAFFVKLGAGGAWERDSIREGKLRIG